MYALTPNGYVRVPNALPPSRQTAIHKGECAKTECWGLRCYNTVKRLTQTLIPTWNRLHVLIVGYDIHVNYHTIVCVLFPPLNVLHCSYIVDIKIPAHNVYLLLLSVKKEQKMKYFT